MSVRERIGAWLDLRREYATVMLRVFISGILIYGTHDNVIDAQRMLLFRDFVDHHGFPFPMLSAYVGVYVQFLGGLMLLVGLLTRWVAAVLALNWVIAIAMVHWGLAFEHNIAVMSLLVGSLFFVIHGAPTHSLDARFKISPLH